MSTTVRADRSTRSQRRDGNTVAAVGIVVLLAGALLAFALAPLALPASYSWVEHGVSESAAQAVDGAWVARMGFISYGLAVLWLVRVRADTWGPLAVLLHGTFGVSMFGVAAFSAKAWEDDAVFVESEDVLHSAFASAMGFGFIAGVATVMIVRRHRTLRSALPDLVALAITCTVPLTMSSDVWGALQRIMFATGAIWYGREAWLSVNVDLRLRSTDEQPEHRDHDTRSAGQDDHDLHHVFGPQGLRRYGGRGSARAGHR